MHKSLKLKCTKIITSIVASEQKNKKIFFNRETITQYTNSHIQQLAHTLMKDVSQGRLARVSSCDNANKMASTYYLQYSSMHAFKKHSTKIYMLV